MKPLVKKEKLSSSSEELASQRPKRNTCQKNTDVNNGLLWREETDLKKALYASLQETRKKNFDEEDDDDDPEEEEPKVEEPVNNGQIESPKKAKVHAQRKFAQGSTPTSPVPTPQKVPIHSNNSTTELIPYRRPKTEDFLTFLCLRGTSILPPSLDFLNCCSKSDTSSDCHSLSPEPDIKECTSAVMKASDFREKVNSKHENSSNGFSKRHTACKASSKKYIYPNGPATVKKSNTKLIKEITVVKKRKSRDDCDIDFLPPNATSSNRTRASTLHALKEKYKKQRLAAGMKKLLPSKNVSAPSSDKKKPLTKPPSVQAVVQKKSISKMATRNQSKTQYTPANKLNSSNQAKKLAIEKRKSLRSAHIPKGQARKRTLALNKKTMWLRRAKLVPPIVDVDSDSEPEILNTNSEKKSPVQKVLRSPELSKSEKPKNQGSKLSSVKVKPALTSRQILLRKHMQNRLKAKKSILHSKNFKSKAISKKLTAKQGILKRARKNIGLKTMSLRKDHQNKRVTRSAKQQIEEMLWANPEKRTRGQNTKPVLNQKLLRKRHLQDTHPVKKQRLEFSDKNKINKPIKNCDNVTKNKQDLLNDVRKNIKLDNMAPKQILTDSARNIRKVKNSASNEAKSSITVKNPSSSTQSKNTTFKSKTENKIKTDSTKLKIDTLKTVQKTDYKKTEVKSRNETRQHNDSGSSKVTSQIVDNSESKSTITTSSKSIVSKMNNKSSKTISAKITSSTSIDADKKVLSKNNATSSKSETHVKNLASKDRKLSIENESKNVTGSNFDQSKLDSSDFMQSNNSHINVSQAIHSKQDISSSDKINKESSLIAKSHADKCLTSNSYDNSCDYKELNVQNNLNLDQINKANDKDISKLMTLNVKGEELLNPLISEPSTSRIIKKEVNLGKKTNENKFESVKSSTSFKKHDDKKYIKRSLDIKSNEKAINKKVSCENSESGVTNIKKCNLTNKADLCSKSNVKKSIEKNMLCPKVNTIIDSDSYSSSEELENIYKNKKIDKSNQEPLKVVMYDPSTVLPVACKKPNICEKIELKSKNTCFNLTNITNELTDKPLTNQDQLSKLNENGVFEKSKHSVNSLNSKIDSDDDSDSDVTIDQYLKLTSAITASSSRHNSCDSFSIKKEINQDISSLSSDTKNFKQIKKENDKIQCKSLKDNHLTKKDSEKEIKSKKDGLNSKHKKDKDYSKSKSHDKSKKEEKSSKKESEKSLAKLLKKEKEKERLKSIKKEEKSKHKRDGSSSSKSSKRDFDKDGSELKRESEKDYCSVDKLYDKKVDFTDIKKEKSSKKESSKMSRSNSYDETKSPKKKKKYNEFKDIEKIKNLISNSCILNEISGFKAFKRRLSGDKSELKKRLSKKKQKKLALLKEKKLSKKLSSKLLRKYSEKKGLKSKKSKLKKKGLKKESKSSSLSKVHSKNKKQKHKVKDHHKKDSQEKNKMLDLVSTVVTKVSTSLVPNIENSHERSITDQSLKNTQTSETPSLSSTNVKMSTSDVGISANFHVDSVSEVIPADSAVVSTNVTQAISSDLILSSTEEMSTVIAADYGSVVEEGFPAGTILLATRDVSQVPVHFIPDTLFPKTMADAATNTYEEDIEEVISSIPEHMKSDEMSVGTQTITPAGSPSPTLETRSLPSTISAESELLNKSDSTKLNIPISLSKKIDVLASTSVTSPLKLDVFAKKSELPKVSTSTNSCDAPASKSANLSNTPIKSSSEVISVVKNIDKPVPITPTKLCKEPVKTVNTSSLLSTSPIPKKLDTTVKSEIPGPSKVKKRTPSLKKQKLQDSFTFSKSESFPLDVAKMVSAPVYYPTSEEFQDPLEYISKIYPEAGQFGICKIIPPASFKPECKVSDDLRFMALNQYLHKMLYRWGSNVQHTACIKKHLKSQKVKLEQAPLIGGIELDISKFYHTVQQFGGLQQVIEKNKWHKVADVMRVPKAAQDRVTKLYDAYCKYLVSYDTLPSEEKKKLDDEVIAEHKKYVMLRNSKDSDKEEELDEEDNIECVTKGRSMPLSNFFRIARNTMSMWFKNDHPLPEEVEHEFWKIVTERNQHIVVHAGNIDSNTSQSGFPVNKSTFAKHPWNLKVLTNNSRSILRCMGPVSGITSPTLHVGMLYTTSCWYRDPHSLPWIEYLHTGASKIWYGIPANGSEKFKNAMKKIVPEYCTDKPLWLSSESSMIPPDLLVKNGSSLSKTIQKSGQFVVIFPESFTSTICCGYCVSESVYFAPTSWLDLAEKAFQDIHESCESPAFSFERLLFSIAKDPKPQLKALQKILPKVENIRSKELNLRAQLNEAGLKDIERLPTSEPQDKKKKSKILIDDSELECEICSAPCYLSRVIYPQEDTVYCLPHALEHIQKKNLKSCKLMYTYDEKDFNDVITRVNDLVSTLPKDSTKKKSPKKKVLPISEK